MTTHHQCISCYETSYYTAGVVCKNGHFLCCTTTNCFKTAIETTQIPKLHRQLQQQQTNNNTVLPKCPECDACYTTADMQRFPVVEKVWNDALQRCTEKLIVARQQQHAILQQQQGEKQQVQQTSANHMKMKAFIDKVRNDTLNLSCPHCSAVYFDFDACLSVECNTCNGYFCAMCHTSCTGSEACHAHVLQCELNEGRDYFCNATVIQKIQCQYRKRKLMKELDTLEKKDRDFALLELAQDMKHHNIEFV